MKKIFIAILTLIIIALPFGIVINAIFKIPPQYENSFLGVLSDKCERIASFDEPKVVIIGGSSVAFGMDSTQLQTYLKKPCVNFGLYATLGTKVMLDLAENDINKGDIIVICPETNLETYSLFSSGEAMWQGIDSNSSLFFELSKKNFPKLLASSFAFLNQKNSFFKNNNAPNPKGTYKRESFNEYTDIGLERPFNVMLENFDPSSKIKISEELINDDFIDYVNKFVKKANFHGAKVYFSFSPMNKEALLENDELAIFSFCNELGKKLNCEIISDIHDYILDSNYFYDTNFHLNDAGKEYRTSLLAKDILRSQGLKETTHELSFPPATKRPSNFFETQNIDDTTGFFLYEKTTGGKALCGITKSGKEQTQLTLPTSTEGESIVVLKENAFLGCDKLEKIIIGKNTNLKIIESGAFLGAKNLTRVDIQKEPQNITVGDGVFEKLNENFAIYVPRDLYGDFATDYIWSKYTSKIKLAD